MYILSETGGQTCNKHFQYLYYLKLCIYEKCKLRVLLPDITIEDYPNLLNNPYISFPFYSTKLTRFCGIKRSLKVTKVLTKVISNSYIQFLFHQLSFHKLCFLSGRPTWIGTDETYSDIRPTLQYLFDLRADLKKIVDDNFNHQDKIYCGVHMRGGDYRSWLGGKYFYDQIVYRRAMERFLSFFQDKKVCFFICSNEPIQEELFKGFEYFTISDTSVSQDIYALSCCDYIIGTFSSFNAWASLLGRVPLFTIMKKIDIDSMDLSDFSPVINYKQKENGWRYPRYVPFFKEHTHPWLYKHSNKEYLLNMKFE